jgi:hypothetical protein
MGEQIRAKFKCVSEKKFEGWGQSGEPRPFFYDYEFQAVTSGSEENKRFFAATPSGNIHLSTLRAGMFEPGKEYYLDFTPAG